MSKLFIAANNETQTTNGMGAYKSTLNSLVDLFCQIGTNRGSNIDSLFLSALQEDTDKTLRILQWTRDIRGGAGERFRFRSLLDTVVKNVDKETVVKLINNIPMIGRFDDLHSFIGTDYENIALSVHAEAIRSGNGLAAKWAPRKGLVASKLRNILGLNQKQYRKLIVSNSKTVEQLMCANSWEDINYSHVPSQASRIYSKSFRKHDNERYSEYLEDVICGSVKMNAEAIFPHEIYVSAKRDSKQADAQWKNLPNYLEGVEERILPICDVSGSMSGTPMAISVALGLYFSERAKGMFKDCVVTFSEEPKFVTLQSNKTLSQRMSDLENLPWGMNTNFEAVFDKLLYIAKANNLTNEDLPTKLLVMSDMQFDSASSKKFNNDAVSMIEKKFKKSGFEMPSLVFWNINGGNVPAKFDKKGVALVSGCSPSVVKAVLGADIDPVKVMLKAIMVDRYKL